MLWTWRCILLGKRSGCWASHCPCLDTIVPSQGLQLKPLKLQIRQKRNTIFPAASYVSPSVKCEFFCHWTKGLCGNVSALGSALCHSLSGAPDGHQRGQAVLPRPCRQQLSIKAWLTLKWKYCLPCKLPLLPRPQRKQAVGGTSVNTRVRSGYFPFPSVEFSQGAKNLFTSSGAPPSIWLLDGWNAVFASWTRAVLSNGPKTSNLCQHHFAQRMSTKTLDIGKLLLNYF